MTGIILPNRHSLSARQIKQQSADRIARLIADEVQKAYPGHQFEITVQPDHRGGGTVFIDYHAVMLGTKARYVVHNPDDTDKVVKFCGEILERAGLPRGRADAEQVFSLAPHATKEAFASR